MHRPAKMLHTVDRTGNNRCWIMASIEQGDIAVGNGQFNFTPGHPLNQLFRGQIIMQFDGNINTLFLEVFKSFLVSRGRSNMNGLTGKFLQLLYFYTPAVSDEVLLDVHISI